MEQHGGNNEGVETGLIVKQEMIEVIETKEESTSEHDLSVVNHTVKAKNVEQPNPSRSTDCEDEPIVKQEIVWVNEPNIENETKIEKMEEVNIKMERDCFDGEETSNGFVLKSGLCDSTKESIIGREDNKGETEMETETSVNPAFESFLRVICDKCGCELCVCSVENGLEDRGKMYSCTDCEYETADVSSLEKHVQKHEEKQNARHMCTICNHKAISPYKLKEHLMTKHTGEKPFSCKMCEYRTAYKFYLSIHMAKHSGEKPYSCNQCEFKTKYDKDLTRHLKIHNEGKRFFCNQCDYKTAHKDCLKTHMSKHNGDKPFACNQCEYKTARHNHLETHMKIHSREKPYSCNQCEYKALHEKLLVAHMRIHSGEKLYSCDQCDYKTVRNNRLKIHLRIHSGDKPFSCDQCEFKTAQKKTLVVHMRVHSGDKPFSCNQCNYKTKHSISLTRHVMKIHS